MEDVSYCSSSQFRLWTFTPESLAAVRKATNAAATTQVREAIQRARDKNKRKPPDEEGEKLNVHNHGLALYGSEDQATAGQVKEGEADAKETECLTPEEELKLVRYYCRKIMEIAQVFKFPTDVKATAPIFLRRFFTRTSPMTYHPKTLLSTILYLTTKTENHYISLHSFSAKIPKSTPEEILAPEFVVAMGLRWCFEVKHPFRGLEGGIMELVKVSEGNYINPPVSSPSSQKPNGENKPAESTSTTNGSKDTSPPPPPPTTAAWKLKLESLSPQPGTSIPSLESRARIERAHGKARAILSSSALLTDAYFLFSPPQIFLGALYIVDTPLTLFYIDLKHPYPSQAPIKEQVISTVQACAEEIRKGGDPGDAGVSKDEMEEAIRIDKKLYFCRNPEKVDLLSANKLMKRGATEDEEGDGSGGLGINKREREVKKRKLEREKSFREGEDLFGSAVIHKAG